MRPAYVIGALDAYDHLGMHKHANAGLMRQLALPVAAGGALGGIGGAMASDEGNRVHGALMGAGLGAVGAGIGHGLGGMAGRSAITKAESGLAEGLAGASKSKAGKELAGAARKGRMAKYTAGPEGTALQEAVTTATKEAPRTQRGGTMLGGVLGTGGGMGLAAGLEDKAPPPMPPAMNPYGY